MYRIEQTPFGFHLTFSGMMSAAEMQAWKDEALRTLRTAKLPKPFRVYVDMRDLAPLPQDAQEVLVTGQAEFKNSGMDRSVGVVAKRMIAMQMRNTALASGIESGERYISVEEEHWESEAMDWILKGVEPSHK